MAFLVLDYAIKIIAIGVVPENRKTGSSFAWLLLILFVPVLGLPLFVLLGSPYVRGRRHQLQGEINDVITSRATTHPASAQYIRGIPGVGSIVQANQRLASLPLVVGRNAGLHSNYEDAIAAMAVAVDRATEAVHAGFYIMAWDQRRECSSKRLLAL